MPDTYHLRKSEREIKDRGEIDQIMRAQQFMTLAMCRENQPYLVTLNYGYDQDAGCIYFHCANEGKKLAYLRENPTIWGQILDDRGYVQGECTHAYRCIEFEGVVDFLTAFEGKKHALHIMIDQIEPDPEPLKQRMVTEDRVSSITIGRVRITSLTAKKNNS